MKLSVASIFSLVVSALLLSTSSASVFLPSHGKVSPLVAGTPGILQLVGSSRRRSSRLSSNRTGGGRGTTAMAIPGYGVAEQVFVGGFQNFLSIYNLVITARILLSWFPQAQGVAALQPVYAITDPYLNLFRGVIPPLFGLDLSPIAAFFLLNVMSNATAAVGAEIPDSMKTKHPKALPFLPRGPMSFMLRKKGNENPVLGARISL